jgi:sigma-54 dependent transcriptional regulator, acetoin dehydrogenase operon transcriptional activator AcoR
MSLSVQVQSPMSGQQLNLGHRVPSTVREWDRVREVKLEVFRQDPLSIDPADYPDVRSDVVLSWKRSLLAGVDPWATDIPFDADFNPTSRLAQVAQPIMNRLEDQISDLSSWGFLTDRACRLLTAVVGESPQAQRLRQVDMRPGLCFAEDAIGTNGIACAHEQQRSFIISGSEHFRMNTEILTTTGVIIKDPYTKRFVGTLGVHCRREYSSAAVLPLVTELGRSIEAQLLASRADSEREFFDFFLRTQRRYRGAAVGITKTLYVANNQARELLGDADEELLRRLAEEASIRSRERTVRRRLSSGGVAAIKVTPLEQARGSFAAVLTLEPVTVKNFAGAGLDTGTDTGRDFRGQLEQALAERHPVLLSGERGAGKSYEAAAALALDAGAAEITRFDADAASLQPQEWLAAFRTALADPGRRVLLSHLEELPLELMATVADLVAGAKAQAVGTTSEQVGDDSPAVFVRESFPVVVGVPPLRDRAPEFADLCGSILADLANTGDGHPAVLAPKALSALVSHDWPGNVRQLRQVLATSRIRAAGSQIRLSDLPARYGNGHSGRFLGEMERVERQTLMVALRETGGNRNLAAEKLGISRATIYRKLKRYELH